MIMVKQKQKIDLNSLLPIVLIIGMMVYFYYATPPKLTPSNSQLSGTAVLKNGEDDASTKPKEHPFAWIKDVKGLPLAYEKAVNLQIEATFENKGYGIAASDALYKLSASRAKQLKKYPFRILVTFLTGESIENMSTSFKGTAHIVILDKKK